MEIYCSVLITFGLISLIIAVAVSDNRAVFLSIFIGVILILASNDIAKKADRGKPAPSLEVLVTGEKYEVTAVYEKYIVIKSATDNGNNGKLRFIGPLDFGVITGKKYIKTAEGNLEKIE